ncbi:MAG: O-antigen ligase family protein [Candidatus Eisenbacteria bacterium]
MTAAAADTAVASSRPDPIGAAAHASFLLYVAALATSIAPMEIAGGLCLALTLAWWWRQRGGWVRTPVLLPGLAWLMALIVASIFSLDPAGSFPRVVKGLMPAIVTVAASHTADPRRGRRAVAVLFGAAGVVALLGLAGWAMRGASFEARDSGLVGHYMTFAGQLLLVLPVAAGVALCAREPRWRWSALALAVVGVVALASTFTRSSWIGFVVSLLVLLGARRPRWLIGLAVLVALAFVFAPGAYRERLDSMFDPTHPWNRERWLMWGAGLRMFRDHPVTGVGLQDLHPLYAVYKSPEAQEAVGHLHNVVIMILAAAGVVGLVAFMWLYASLVRTAVVSLRAQLARGGVAAGVRLGVVAGLAGFLAAGMFEWNFGDEELLHQLYTLVGIAWVARLWDGS